MEHGAVHVITSLLDEYGDRLSGFRALAVRLASTVDRTADGPVKVDVSGLGIQFSVERPPAEASVVVELPFDLSQNGASPSEIKIYQERREGFREWLFEDPEEAVALLTALLEHRHPVNP